jgi:peroxiredoxin
MATIPAFAVDEEAAIDEQAASLTRKVAETYQELESARAKAETKFTMEAKGMSQYFSSEYSIAMKRPNKLSVVHEEGMMGGTIVTDGDKLWAYIPAMNKYVESEAGDSVGALLDDETSLINGILSQAVPFLRELLSSEPYDNIMEGVTAATYEGDVDLDGTACQKMSFEQEDFDWEMWVEKESMLVRKVVTDLSKSMAELQEQMAGTGDIRYEISVLFDDWEINVELADDAFVFDPPEDAEKADSFFGGEEEPHALLEKEAPDFELPLLDGETVSMADYRGKQVVMLDFWATWCPPCRRGLPVMQELADAYKDEGLVFFAINQRENEETVSKFMEKEELSFQVLLDKKGAVGDSYGVEGIPQTVLIGKDGIVKVVHVGFSPGMEKELRASIEEALTADAADAEEAAE